MRHAASFVGRGSSARRPARAAPLLMVIAIAMVLALPRVARGAEPLRVGLLPVEEINLARGESAALRANFGAILQRQGRVRLDTAPSTVTPGCAVEIACLQQLGARLGAHKLVALRVGRLGDTTVLRLMAFDVPRGMRQGTWQEVLRRADGRAVTAALERLAATFLPPPPAAPPRRPFYKRWWFWTVAGVVVAGSVTAAVLATRPRNDNDYELTPPPR